MTTKTQHKSRIIDSLNPKVIRTTAARCREQGIIIPTFRQLDHPEEIPVTIQNRLNGVGLWDVNPLNLFRITWKNDLNTGRFGSVNHFEIPSEISGVSARIIGIVGKYFPTGAHKVGAAFGCLVPRLVSGNFDPTVHKAVWPSTGNFCRGGAFDCALLGCTPIAILPEEMSQERFTWLKEIGAEVIATPGCESNVKEIYDKCWELRGDPHNIIFNQFEEFGNPIFHYQVTGHAIEDIVRTLPDDSRLAAYISATGSAGTIAAGDYLKTRYPNMNTIATEALQCPTMFMNGFGGHRIEGIGDKHIPWVHNVRSTDAVAAIDDEECLSLLRLFNEEEGLRHMEQLGLPSDTAKSMSLLGISSICNLLAAIKAAKYYELNERDVIVTVFTDSVELYQSRLLELRNTQGAYSHENAVSDHAAALLGQKTDYFRELNYRDRKAIHNLKYYTWVEQQGKSYEEILEQWQPEYWRAYFEDEVVYFDELIQQMNAEIGLI